MRKLFIIGTGRNGSKLVAKIIADSVGSTNVFGEIVGGLEPEFFKNVYLGKIKHSKAVKDFKRSRANIIKGLEVIYVEKNHLIVPVLNIVLEAYPDALFLYVPRNSKDIIRSLYTRKVYENIDSVYEKGRLVPNKKDKYYLVWKNMNKFEKVCWYVYTMTCMCEDFLKSLDKNTYRVLSYEDIVNKPDKFEDIFNWLCFSFNIDSIKNILSVQQGSSARSIEELSFKVNKNKIKNSQHWKDWSAEKNKIYNKTFYEKINNIATPR